LEFLDGKEDDSVAEAVADGLQKVDEFVRHNLEAFRKIIKK